METKICNKCNESKPIDSFTNTKYKGEIKKRSTCKQCTTLLTKAWVEKNKAKRKEYVKNYSEKNREYISLKSREYYANNRRKAIEYNVHYKKRKRKEDELYRLTDNIRKLILKAFCSINQKKNTKTIKILGCTFLEFKTFLESKFEAWMNWQNYGLYNGKPEYGWDLDHIVPISKAKTVDDLIKLNHYTNFQPLCSYINRNQKRNKTDNVRNL